MFFPDIFIIIILSKLNIALKLYFLFFSNLTVMIFFLSFHFGFVLQSILTLGVIVLV
jgi:hypothetical protein